MMFFYNLSIILLLLISKSYTFVINHYKSHSYEPNFKKHSFSLRNTIADDEPFIFTQSSEPGKHDEIILCDRETHGINKIISDIDRRNQGNDPLYPVGSFVYVKRGKFRCSRGTVLFNKASEIGKPYDVLVALDCRNSEGLLKQDLSMDHGTGHWISENDLSDDEIYNKNTPPPLNYEWMPNNKYALIKTSRIYNSKLIDSTKYEQIVSIYNDALETGSYNYFTPIIAYIQIARAFREFRYECQNSREPESQEKARSFKKIISETIDMNFMENLVEKIIETLETYDISIVHCSWLLWATAKLHYFDIRLQKYRNLVNAIDKKITFKNLKTLSQPCLSNILLFYTRFKHVNYKHLFSIAKIVSSIPKREVNPLLLNLLLRVFYLTNLDPGDFLKYVTDYVMTYHYKIPKYQAICLLRSVQDFKHFTHNAVDKLYSIIFSYEGDTRDAAFDSSNFYNLLRASIRDKEMFAIFEKGAYSSDIILEPYIILRSLYILSYSGYNKMKIWMVDKALSNIDAFSDLELKSLIFNCCWIDNIPKELLKRIYKHFKEKMFHKMDHIGASFIFRFMNKHPFGNDSDVLDILKTLNEKRFNYQFTTTYSLLRNLEPLVKRYDIDLYKQFPRFLEDMLSDIRKDARYNIRTFGLSMYFISEMCKELYEKASKLALEYYNKTRMEEKENKSKVKKEQGEDNKTKTEERIDLSKVDKTTINLAQFMYSIFSRVTRSYDDYSDLEVIRFEDNVEDEVGLSKDNKENKSKIDEKKRIDRISYFDKDMIVQWSLLYLYLSVKSGFINQTNFPRDKVMTFLKPRREYLTNLDLKMIKETMMLLGSKDMEMYELLTSIPKGIDVIAEKKDKNNKKNDSNNKDNKNNINNTGKKDIKGSKGSKWNKGNIGNKGVKANKSMAVVNIGIGR